MMIAMQSTTLKSMNHFRESIAEKTRRCEDYLIIAFGFTMVFSSSLGAILAGCIIVAWLMSGRVKERLSEIRSNRIAMAFLLFFTLHVVGLLWTEDMGWGLHMLGKQWRMILAVILISMMKKEHTDRYLGTFLAGMTILHMISFLNIFGWTEQVIQTHVTYNVLLAIAAYILLHYILFDSLEKKYKILLFILFISFSINMFMTIGRSGQLAYFMATTIAVIQYNNKNILKGVFISVVLVSISIVALYNTNSIFRHRVDIAIDEIKNYERDKPSKYVNDRITFFLNTLHIIKLNPIIGVGTGDFPGEYKIINSKFSPDVLETVNPHNNYLMVLSQFGIVGFIVFISIFYFQLINAKQSQDKYKNLKFAIPLIFIFVMNFDTYMISYYTSAAYIYFTGFLYKD